MFISNENPISELACGVYLGVGKEWKKANPNKKKLTLNRKGVKLVRYQKKLSPGAGAEDIANPVGLRIDNDLQLPTVRLSILDKRTVEG